MSSPKGQNFASVATDPRAFPDVINEWTDELLRLNQEASIEQVALILRLGTLGQRLIFEANAIGQNESLRMMIECCKEQKAKVGA